MKERYSYEGVFVTTDVRGRRYKISSSGVEMAAHQFLRDNIKDIPLLDDAEWIFTWGKDRDGLPRLSALYLEMVPSGEAKSETAATGRDNGEIS